jgi:hypothetical protein
MGGEGSGFAEMMTSLGPPCRLRAGRRASSASIANQVVNIDDPVGKIEGRRKVTEAQYLNYALGLQNNLQNFPRPSFPQGVFRFKPHEEADQWLMDHLTRKPAN